jgi:hypothetical protein
MKVFPAKKKYNVKIRANFCVAVVAVKAMIKYIK